MTELDRLVTPAPAEPAVGRFARRWAAALLAGGRVGGTVEDIAAVLRPLVPRLAVAVRDGDGSEALGRDVGRTLVRFGFGAAAVVGPTVVLLVEGFTDDFPPGAPGWPGPEELRRRVVALAARIAEGFAEAARSSALTAQEELQRAALAAVRAAERDRSTSEARFRALFDHAGVGIGIIDMTGRVIDGNAAWAEQMGCTVAELRGTTIRQLVTPGGSQPAMRLFTELLAGARDGFRMEIAHTNRRAALLHLDLSVSVVRVESGEPDFLVGVAVDITDRKRLEDRLWHESRHDPLTALPNRTLFFERLDELLGAPDGRPVGVCYIDLDGFKSINDGLGHDVGDRLLVQVADRLERATGTGRLLARLGGDEFGILVDDADPGDEAGRVLEALTRPVTVDGRELTVSASVGVVDSRSAGRAADALMRAADISLYQAKARGKARWERHDPQDDDRQVAQHVLATEMSAALAHGQFFLEYQPLVSLRDGSVRRFEALVRWRHPRFGLLGPDSFIRVAEENGQIVPLGRWVLETACREAREWQRAVRRPSAGIGINVNVAVGQLHDPALSEHISGVLAESGLSPRLLHLELTESAVLGEAPGPMAALTGLADAGVRLVIDDFGTGYSNLAHLSRLPASELKIAGAFLRSAPGGDLANEKILAATIRLAHALGLSVTAEGVENAAQAQHLSSLDCDTAQGWWFGRPLPAPGVLRLLGG